MTEVEKATCTACGKELPRSDMFGANDALVCPPCAEEVRARYGRGRPVGERIHFVTTGILAAAGTLFVAAHLFGAPWVEWLMVTEGVWRGEAWRFLTSAFLHMGPLFGTGLIAGLMHVVGNGFWIAILGRVIEPKWGPWRFLALVVGSAMASSAAQWLAGGSGVGLSGVVYALAGFLYVFRPVDADAAAVMDSRTVQGLVIWFFVCVAFTLGGFLQIANWAHGVGALWGFAAGWAFRSRHRVLALAVLALATVALVVAAMQPSLHRWPGGFDPSRYYETGSTREE